MQVQKRSSEHYRGLLNITDKKMYDFIHKSLKNFSSTVELDSKSKIRKADFLKIVEYIFLDHPELFYLVQTRYRIDQLENKIILRFYFLYSKHQTICIKEDLDNVCRKIVEKCHGYTQADQLKYLHNVFIHNISFDNSPQLSHDAFSVVGALLNKKAVCNGFASAFKMICDILKIPCIVVSGKDQSFEKHAWNIVKIDNQYFHLDLTWDSISKSNEYYLVSDNTISRDHFWDESIVPICDDFYSVRR